MLQKIRKSKTLKIVSLIMVICLLKDVFAPLTTLALTSGPSQPEIQSFEPIGTNQMVDLFSGDFTYNIPLFELPGPSGGYPFNLAYHSGITMDQEASWVGLGWTLNPGAINRQVRAIPDDFNGDELKYTLDMKPNITTGLNLGANVEILGADASIGLDLKVFHNNYTGVGYGFGFGYSITKVGGCEGLGLGMNFDYDTRGGASINASVSYEAHQDGINNNFSVGLGLNSKNGLDLSLGMSTSANTGEVNSNGNDVYKNIMGGTSTISFAKKSHNPIMRYEHVGDDLFGNYKIGGQAFGLYGNFKEGYFFNSQKLKDYEYKAPAYGYLNLETPFTEKNANNKTLYEEEQKYLLDFNRDRDGLITPNSSNLASPNLTYDYYNILGQGTGGMFRPYRNDFGHVHDPFTKTEGHGRSYSIEVSGGKHWGAGKIKSKTFSKVGGWKSDDGNSLSDHYMFQDNEQTNSDIENVYFKTRGEATSIDPDEINNLLYGEDPVTFPVTKNGYILEKVKYDDDNDPVNIDKSSTNKNNRNHFHRMPRNQAILPLTNKTATELGQFNIKHYSFSDNNYRLEVEEHGDELNRITRNANDISEHIGGISVLNTNGYRYEYGIPVYNKVKEEYLFSVNGGKEFCSPEIRLPVDTQKDLTEPGALRYEISKDYEDLKNSEELYSLTETPPYAYSYLLTSVLGNDYVDLTGDGPTDDDYGYWVKFNYIKKENNYGWRAPFKDANFSAGLDTHLDDDKGSFVYGEKEIWYLATVETKTHVAEFVMSPRDDARGADRYNRTEKNGDEINEIFTEKGKNYKLDRINLYVKKEYFSNKTNPVPLQSIHFKYDYSLCKGVYNNINRGTDHEKSGKLTLRKIYFTYQNNNRGQFSPYEFKYSDINPDYNINRYDRWGAYKHSGSECENREFPYSMQYEDKTIMDEYASAWNMDEITLPSGATIDVNYERDDYAYVQHKRATQMFKIAGLGEYGNDDVYSKNSWSTGESANKDARRIYFQLENPIPEELDEDDPGYDDYDPDEAFFNQYIKGLKRGIVDKDNFDVYQIYFKIKIKLRDKYYEYVSGYAELDYDVKDNPGQLCGLVDNDEDGNYEVGYITIKSFKPGKNDKYYHTFATAAWQFMRTVRPALLLRKGAIEAEPATTDASKADKAKSLKDILSAVTDIFRAYTTKAFKSGWGNKIELSQSVIRLTTPDKKKYGGGSRVSRIALNDSWEDATGEASSEYGQVYDYTMRENDEIISSGVASYEPMIGADENALRYAKLYGEKIPFKTPNNLYFEFPVNESYFPGASVGYRQVTVKSLATDDALKVMERNKKDNTNDPMYSSTGVSVHEFYTCKDYPVITEEIEINKKELNNLSIIPLVGTTRENNLTASQGYVIKLNDMHGKVRSVKHFAQDDNGNILDEPISSVEYIYKNKDHVKIYEDEEVKELDNKVKFLDAANPEGKIKDMGVEYEFFCDMRKSSTAASQRGGNVNIDIIFGFPVPTFWPIINGSFTELKTAVNNKVIHKSGILLKTIQVNEGTTIETENLVFDEVTGQPLLTSVNTKYDDQLMYNYSIPAYTKYTAMGPAYKNLGVEFTSTAITHVYQDEFDVTVPESAYNLCKTGDEFVIDDNLYKGYLIDKKPGNVLHVLLDYSGEFENTSVRSFFIARSGHSNQLEEMAASITTIDLDPTDPGNISTPDPITNIDDYGDSRFSLPASYDYTTIDNVISYNVVTFSNNWANENWNRSRGIWRPYQTYAYYFGERSLGNNEKDIDLKNDGLLNNVPMFDWNSSIFPKMLSSWTLTNEITRVNQNSFEIENRDVLGLYSSAIYGYNNNLPIAVAANAAYNEIGFEGFEEYSTGSSFDITNGNIILYNLSQGQLNLTLQDEYDIIVAKGEYLAIDRLYSENDNITAINLIATLDQTDTQDEEQVQGGFSVDKELGTGKLAGKTILKLTTNTEKFTSDRFWDGKVIIPKSRSISSPSNNASIVDRGHVSKKSLQVSENTSFEQHMMKLQPGEEYVVSCWVSNDSEDDNVPNGVVNLKFYDRNNTELSQANAGPMDLKGDDIEGWQKLEYTFVAPEGVDWFEVEFAPPCIIGGCLTAYYDDIRIFPADGNIKTYVYNPDNYRLKATLDENNYATLYSYDEAGNLFLVKKETEEGIKTIQESRSYQPVRKNNKYGEY